MKRTSETKENIRLAKRKFFADGGETFTKGKTKVFNKITRIISFVLPEVSQNLMLTNPEYTIEKLFRVTNDNDHKMYITETEKLPNGYKYAKNSGR